MQPWMTRSANSSTFGGFTGSDLFTVWERAIAHYEGAAARNIDKAQERLATALRQRASRALQEAREVIPTRHARLHLERRAARVALAQDFDEGHEEVVQAVR